MKKYVMPLLYLISSFVYGVQADIPHKPSVINIQFLAEITAKGQKITGVALEYEDNILANENLRQLYQVAVFLDDSFIENRQVMGAYTFHQPTFSHQATAGKYVILALDEFDKSADLYQLKLDNISPIRVRERDKEGKVVWSEKVQSVKIPEYYNARLKYLITQKGNIKLANGKTLGAFQEWQTADKSKVSTAYLDQFSHRTVYSNRKENSLNYRLYQPMGKQKNYPLTIFLHGSGQVGSDNLAQLLSSKGAISTLQYEEGFVLAPQYSAVFDPFDQGRGIHWQTPNRIDLLVKMIEKTVREHGNIDKNRIYIVGLSRGAEGGLNLLLKRPDWFAGALLMSGREASSLEWIDGNANKDNLMVLRNMPIWFFHSKEDSISPVKGSRINYRILAEQLQAPFVKYTEFSTTQAGDNGIIHHNPHNTWDAVFNSPEVMMWLLEQRKR